MNRSLRQAAQQALEALEDAPYMSNKDDYGRLEKVTEALRKAINSEEDQMRMDREAVIRMAQEAGFDPHDMSDDFTCNLIDIERFAALVAAHEREACARLCDQMFHDWCNQEFEDEDEAYRNKPDAEDCKKAIRARVNT